MTLAIVAAPPLDVIQHEEVYLSKVKGIIGRAKNSLESFVGKTVLIRLEVQIVIADDVIPRDSH